MCKAHLEYCREIFHAESAGKFPYLYGQADGLAKSGVNVSIYTNNITENPNYNGVSFFQFYMGNRIFVAL